MHQIKSGAKWMCPFYTLVAKTRFLFRESGGYPLYYFEYMQSPAKWGTRGTMGAHLYFPQKTRHFDARMTIDPIQKIVKDYLGTPALFIPICTLR